MKPDVDLSSEEKPPPERDISQRPRRRASHEKRNASRKAASLYVLCGLLVSVFLLGAKLFLEQFSFEQQAEYETRAYLLRLLPAFRESGADAIVLDISHLPGGTRDSSTLRRVPTPRQALRELLDQLVELSPAAIGIDIDFSGDAHGWLNPADPEFFDHCLELNRRIPIRLGVSRSIPSVNGLWLISKRYSGLAAAIFVTDSDSGDMPISVGLKDSPARILTLGASLAAAAKSGTWDPLALKSGDNWLKDWMFEQRVERTSPQPPYSLQLSSEEAPVNFSVVRQISREYIPKVQPQDLTRYASRITGRVVVIGDVENTHDVYPIPGDRVNRSGVFLHAAQAHSFTSEPVYVFSHSFRIFIDLAIPALIMLCVLVARRVLQQSPEEKRQQVERYIGVSALVVIAAAGVLLAYFYRVFWLDFTLVFLFLFIHHPLEHWLLAKVSPTEGHAHAS